jgi:hypothetical protein
MFEPLVRIPTSYQQLESLLDLYKDNTHLLFPINDLDHFEQNAGGTNTLFYLTTCGLVNV